MALKLGDIYYCTEAVFLLCPVPICTKCGRVFDIVSKCQTLVNISSRTAVDYYFRYSDLCFGCMYKKIWFVDIDDGNGVIYGCDVAILKKIGQTQRGSYEI